MQAGGSSNYEEDDASGLAKELFGGRLGVEAALGKLRNRLLDLSLRNRLLNYKHPKGRSFQFSDEPDLNLLFERLSDGRSVPLVYVPEPPSAAYEAGKKPEARIYARQLGIGTSVDIGPSRPDTPNRRLAPLQVLHYPVDLERLAKKIASEARTVIEETGTNMLYLVFGFLEYFEDDESDKAVHAPLLAVPVNLLRVGIDEDTRTDIYDLSFSGEDSAENITLREKLKQQFRLELPELGDDDTPETYFAKIGAAVSKRHRWTVKRRLSLGFLSFGKLAIWRDLDPARSPELLSSELLKNIFEGGNGGRSDAFHAEDYPIDEHPDGELPLIFDADSSQHSAIIDVKHGKSLVINGPPGTGKSQTITNIIASAIADGKTVLFVSEKLAALEVVKQRLESAGLGDFCLELHSHKSHKKQLLENIDQRINRKFSAPGGYAKRLEALRERRKALNGYAASMASQAGNRLEFSLHDILWRTEAARAKLGECRNAVAAIFIDGAAEWDATETDKARSNLVEAASALDEMGFAPADSPWIGFEPGLLIAGDEVPIGQVLAKMLAPARYLHAESERLKDALETEDWTLAAIASTAESLPQVLKNAKPLDEQLLERMFAGGVASVPRVAETAASLWQQLEKIRGLNTRSASGISRYDEDIGDALDEVRSKALAVLDRDVLTLGCAALRDRLSDISRGIEKVHAVCAERPTRMPQDRTRLRALLGDVRLQAFQGIVDVDAQALEKRGSVAGELAIHLDGLLRQVSEALAAARVPFNGRVEEVQALFDGRGLPELLPDALDDGESLQKLRGFIEVGWGDWSAGEFQARGGELADLLAAAMDAAEGLRAMLARVGLVADLSPSALESIDAVLGLSETAPQELLANRSAAYARPDFADTAIRAEELAKSIGYKKSKLVAMFHSDSLPDDTALKAHLGVFRRGDSLFNFLRSDWRAAKRAFKTCSTEKRKLSAVAMGERFAAALATNIAQRDFEASSQFREAFGGLFAGLETDFAKVRRLHGWLTSAQSALIAGEFGTQISAVTLPEQHVTYLVAVAAKVRGWLIALQRLSRAVATLPGLDPALKRAKRVDELTRPLEDYGKTLNEAASVLRKTVRGTATVSRAVELRELKTRISAHASQLQELSNAPAAMSSAFAQIGQQESLLSLSQLPLSVGRLRDGAAVARSTGEIIAAELGPQETIRSAGTVLSELDHLDAACHGILTSQSRRAFVAEVLQAVDGNASDGQALLRRIDGYLVPGATLEGALGAIDAAREANDCLDHVSRNTQFKQFFGDRLKGLETDIAAVGDCVAWANAVKAAAGSLPSAASARLLRMGAVGAAARAESAASSALAQWRSLRSEGQALARWGALDLDRLVGGPSPRQVLSRLERAVEGTSSVIPWSKYLAAKQDAQRKGVEQVLQLAETGNLSTSLLGVAFDYVFHRALGRGVVGGNRYLSRFSGASHEQTRDEFKQLDKELINLNGQLYSHQIDRKKVLLAGVSSGRAGDLTEMALLSKEIKKQKRHIPIRQLLTRAGRSLQQLKPCFMMGPLSVAQYLEQGILQFDLVVMDEASQLRPEDALGAVSRGRQLVVVGDPKQLPPTSFFDRLMDDDEDPEDSSAVVDGVESILGICEHLYRPVRTLRWHYRSRHESLIAFSNAQFYGGRLVVFPSPYKRNRRLGVNYRYVGNGRYENRRNIPEAERVVDAVLDHMQTSPDESLGVVTLNQTQRELIEDLLDKRVRDFPGAVEYLARHEKSGWGFFVKNLENVQGDERDVIFVSTTFGRPAGSTAVRQNFGPINRTDGWRRLNVLFTRSRKRLDLFTSMRPSDVVVDEKTSLGRRALREYLEYAKSGVLPAVEGVPTDREEDSHFEVVVAEALAKHSFEIETQLGVAGFYVDIGVRHPDRPAEFLAGIECDGVSYHSSLSARDRDRIRQEVLESLGWRDRLIRVWSTDWFADPKGQTERLVKFLQARRNDTGGPAVLFTEDDLLEYDEPEVGPESDAPPLKAALSQSSSAGNSANKLPSQDKLGQQLVSSHDDVPPLFIGVGDRVTYRSLDGVEETHTVHIVDSASNLKLGLLNENTPLAQALIGYCPGDIIELRVAGQSAVRLKVLEVHRARS